MDPKKSPPASSGQNKDTIYNLQRTRCEKEDTDRKRALKASGAAFAYKDLPRRTSTLYS